MRGSVPRVVRGNPALARVPAAAVATYHNDFYRSGQYVVPELTMRRAARMHLDHAFAGVVTGNVYAQPLYWRTAAATGGQIIVATESNHVVALDASTGAVVWDRFLAQAVPGGVLPCGNIAPEGITGTPAIDVASGSLYVAATVMAGGTVESRVYALSLKNGQTLPGWPVDIGASLQRVNFSPSWQGQRGALLVTAGRLYVPYGGRSGDCDNYHGSVVAIDTAHPAVTAEWQTLAVRGGIWSVGGVTMADGELFVSTGNTSGASSWSGGEAIVRLSLGLKTLARPADFFAPDNWQQLDDSDQDLGGTNPMPLDVAGQKYILALGKDGNAYLASRTNLGGVGGQLVVKGVSSGEIINGPASWPGSGEAFVAFQGNSSASGCGGHNGLTVLRITAKPSIGMAWCGALSGAGGPIVTTTDGRNNRIVWAVGAEGDEQLHGYAAANGAVVFGGGGSANTMQNVRHMSTILAAQGHLYVPSDGRIYAFTP